MSTLALPSVKHGRALALAIVVVAVVFSVMLLVWATAGGTTGPSSTGGSDPRGAVEDAGVNPWEANDPALVTR